jgi:hypothetical protein
MEAQPGVLSPRVLHDVADSFLRYPEQGSGQRSLNSTFVTGNLQGELDPGRTQIVIGVPADGGAQT